MPKIFWVQCPQCQGKFYCHYQVLWNKGIKLLCPYCGNRFTQEESLEVRA